MGLLGHAQVIADCKTRFAMCTLTQKLEAWPVPLDIQSDTYAPFSICPEVVGEAFSLQLEDDSIDTTFQHLTALLSN